jgi:SAM-dependent methyltransferase
MQTEMPKPHTFQPDIYDKVLTLISEKPSCHILDVGAGEGYFSRILREKGHQVDACDYDPVNFKCPDVPFASVDLCRRLPYDDNVFDCTVSIEVIEHVENHFIFVSEMMRVTKPNGLVIVTTPNVLSLSSRWHFFLYGYTDCSPMPLSPDKPDYFMQHINPISLPQLLFLFERFGGHLITLTTNRLRRSAFIPMLLYPVLAIAIMRKLLRPKYRDVMDLHRRHVRWLLSPANLMGRITIAVARKDMPPRSAGEVHSVRSEN